jgi:hypothetical protein
MEYGNCRSQWPRRLRHELFPPAPLGTLFSLQPPAHAGSSLAYFSTLKMEAIRSSEMSVHIRSTRRHIPEDGILNEYRSLRFDAEHALHLIQRYKNDHDPIVRYIYLEKLMG